MVIADSDSNTTGVILFTAHGVNGISLWEKVNHQVNKCKFQVLICPVSNERKMNLSEKLRLYMKCIGITRK